MNKVLQSLLVTFCVGLFSINGDISRKGHCPTLPREYRNELNCTTNAVECSRDTECPETDKCCFNGCGFFCAAADNIPVEKNGDCPRLQPIYSGPCKDTCLLDDDCPDIQKCCSNGCGLNCMKPGGLLTIAKHPIKNISGPSGLIDKKGNASVEINLAVVLPSQRSENEGTIYKSGSLKNLKEESIKQTTLTNAGGNNTKYSSIPNNQTFPEVLQVQSSERSRDNFPSQVTIFGNSQPDTAPISIQSNPQSVFATKFEHAQPQELNEIITSSESTITKTSTEIPSVTKTSTEIPSVTKTSTEISSVTTTGNSTRINNFLYRVPLRKIKRRKNINGSNQVLNQTESLNITGTLTEKSDNISVSPSLFSNSTLKNEFTVSPDIFPGTDDDVHTKFESSNFTDFYNEEFNTSSSHHNSQENLTESVADEVVDKPGHCPTDQLGNTAVCTEQCSTDRNCTGALKCCSNGCGHECVEPLAFFNKPGECPVLEPGKIGVCIHLCSSDSNCTGMLKCCSNGCGHQCMESQEIINKPGSCPKRNETDNPNKKKYCLHLCDNDSHCSENLKCCEEGCSTKCLLPEFHVIKKPGLCPPVQPGVLGACVEMCSNDSDCYSVQKCCSNGCGHVCRKPIEVRENPGMCPISQKKMNAACFDQCFSDEDCGQVKKCCYNGCAKECQSPNIIKKVELQASERDIASGNEANKIPSEREKLEKPGFCFPIKHTNKTKDCAAFCTNDGHCNGTKKCCPSGCGFECQESSEVPLKEGECPLVPKEYVGSCFNYCRTDEDCAGNQKCCSNGCGKLCLSPNKKFKKEGQCPNDINIKKEYSPCFNLCRIDDDCLGNKICCTQGCSRICTKPDVPAFRLGECPMVMPGESGTCAEECIVDKDCGEFLKCCLNECGSHSCRKPTSG